MAENTRGMNEDWLSLWIGMAIFVLSLFVFMGADLLGWAVKTSVWMDVSKALAPVSEKYAPVKGEITNIEGNRITLKKPDGKEITVTAAETGLRVGETYEREGFSGIAALFSTYLFLLVMMGIGALALGARLGRFIFGFTCVFWISYACWFAGHYAYIAATPDKLSNFGISWSLNLTGEAGYIIALIFGLLMGNFFPRTADWFKEAARPELYIKTAIVIMGAALGVKAAESLGLASAVMFRGLCAIVEAYLIYWALVYFIARKYFKFNPEWAAPLASGISICGVSAAIATGGAIRARPIIPIMVSSLVVIFAVVELLILPYAAKIFLWQEPLVAGAWMGLAVKTDGAAVASGAITDSWIRAQALAEAGINYKEGWILMTATTVKMFIDIFIGVWAFILAVIWCARIECKPGEKVRIIEIWHRFPKFVIGYAATFFIMLTLCWPASSGISSISGDIERLSGATNQAETAPDARPRIEELNRELAVYQSTLAKAKLSTDESNAIRVLFFVMTFFTIGLISNFKKLWEEGIGRLAAVYVISLFGFIIWIGLFISWLFFHGVKPPLAG